MLNECRRLGLRLSGGKFLLLDRIAQSFGTLRTSRAMPTESALAHLSNVRLGLYTGLFGGARMIRQPAETVKDPRPMGDKGNELRKQQSDIFGKLAKDISKQIQAMAQKPETLANAAHGAWNCGRPKAAKDLADLVETLGGIDLMDVIRVGETAPRAAEKASVPKPATRDLPEETDA